MTAEHPVEPRSSTPWRRAASLAALVCVTLGCVATARWVASLGRIEAAANALVSEGMDDRDRVLALLTSVSRRSVVRLRPPDEGALSAMSAADRGLARFYAGLPFNLVPAVDVLERGFVYSGPCGAKSRLLVAMLRSQGYAARVTGLSRPDFTPLHTIVEVRLQDGWVPLDPTYGVHFENEDGTLATTPEVTASREIFRLGIASAPSYPQDLYTYDNVSSLSVFYVVQRVLRALGLATNEGAPRLHARLSAVLPQRVLEYDLGVPAPYEQPELLAALASFGLAGALAWLGKGRRRRAALEATGVVPGSG